MIKKNVIRRKINTARFQKKSWKFFLRFLYPVRCPVCDRLLPVESFGVCSSCEKELPWIVQPICMKCGKMLDSFQREYCWNCMRYPHWFDRGIAAFSYTGSLRSSVKRMKFGNRQDYLDFFAESMVKQGRKWLELWKPDVIIPVPMYWIKKNRRGFNQSELLAEKIGRLTGIPVRKDILKKIRGTQDQKQLSLEERRKNLESAFSLKKQPEGIRTVLLVDDVYTTGSTVDALASVLKQSGVEKVYFLTLCIGKGENIVCTDEKMCYNEQR